MATGILIGTIGIVVFIVLILLGMNIGLALFLVGFVGYAVMVNPAAAFGLLRTMPATQASSYSFMVIPLFIMMGNFAYHAGLSTKLYNAGEKWLSKLPGGLACATISACAGFGAICGSCAATCATMGTISLPEMRKYGYNDRLSTGSIAMGGTLGVLIPPSTPFILYGIMTEQNIASLFISGIIPGLVMAVLCIVTIVIRCKINKDLAPAPKSYTWRERFSSLKGLVGVVALFGIVLGGMFSGFFSVNQSAAVGAFCSILLCAVNRQLTWNVFKQAMKETVSTFAMTFLILIGATVFCAFLSITKLPTTLANAIAAMHVHFIVVLLFMTLIYMFLGMIMDEIPMILLTVPIFMPIIQSYGISLIWFGVYIVMVMELGAISPPVGLNCFIIQGISKDIPLSTVYKGAVPFMLTIFVGIAAIYLFPELCTWLPSLMS